MRWHNAPVCHCRKKAVCQNQLWKAGDGKARGQSSYVTRQCYGRCIPNSIAPTIHRPSGTIWGLTPHNLPIRTSTLPKPA
jgi:hypothetical protein